VRPGSLYVLLVAGVLAYILNALAITSTVGTILLQVGRLGLLFAGAYVLSARRVMAWLGAILAILVHTLDVVVPPLDPRVVRALQDSIAAAFLVWVLVVVLREVFRPGTTGRNAIMGALGGFLVILTIFTRVHGLIETISPGAYRLSGEAASAPAAAAEVATFQYFSTVTMTTVGFGDIVPVAIAARLVTGLEAIVGQMYVAVVIAALVGRAARARSADRAP
jgi:hypothetical protein